MTGHCAPACHCAPCSPSTFVPVMYNPALFTTLTTSSSSSTRSSRSHQSPASSSSPAAPLLVPKPKSVDAAEDVADCSCPGWLCGIGLAGLVVAAVILVIVFI